MRISDWSSDVCSSDLVRVLQQYAEAFDAGRVGVVADVQLDAQPAGARAQHFQRLRVHVVRDEEHVGLRSRRALGQGRRLGCGEIGRGPCRGRGGKYVKMWGVAVHVKKKKADSK